MPPYTIRDLINSSIHYTPDPCLEKDFTHHWTCRGNYSTGIFASWTDHDDVIEFGILSRNENVAANILHVTVVLETDISFITVASDITTEMNFESRLDNLEPLTKAIHFFNEKLIELRE